MTEWQDISTAPKNSKLLAGYMNGSGHWRTVTACYHTQLAWSEDYDQLSDDSEYAPEGWYEESETQETIFLLERAPSHWMPLPSPPNQQAEG